MKRLILALVGVAALTGTAAAADLARPMPQPYYKAPAAVPAYSWTGFYVGVNGGGGFGRSDWDSIGSSFDVNGGLVGGTVGYNYQFGQVVAGIEGDIDWADINGSTTTACVAGCSTRDDWLATIRGRLGYAADRFMPFITGGAAFGDIKATSPVGSATNTNTGWTIGGGIEFAVAPQWTIKAEYLYVDLGKFNCGIACGAAVTDNVSFTTNLVRAGLNYRF
jgi:outer membrane immunogenic protein